MSSSTVMDLYSLTKKDTKQTTDAQEQNIFVHISTLSTYMGISLDFFIYGCSKCAKMKSI